MAGMAPWFRQESGEIAPSGWFAGGSLATTVAFGALGCYGLIGEATATVFAVVFGTVATVCFLATGRQSYINLGRERERAALAKATPTIAPASPEPNEDLLKVLTPPEDSDPSDDEITILQMFVEFKGDHTSEDVEKRMSISRHMAVHYIDRLSDMGLIMRTGDRLRNAHPIYSISRKGRDLLIRRNLLK